MKTKSNVIKFYGIEYDIIYKDKENDDNMGRVEYKKAIIEIDSTMKEDVQKMVLMHECTHIILAHLGETDLNNNESFVERLSNAIFRLMKDNKEVLL